MAYPGPPRRVAGLTRYLFVSLLIIFGILFFRDSARYSGNLDSTFTRGQHDRIPTTEIPIAYSGTGSSPDSNHTESANLGSSDQIIAPVEETGAEKPITRPKEPAHPIDTLIEGADKTFDDLLKKESHDLNSAAAEYRKRRGRHPPPGFDKWFQFAHDNGAVMVEDFFDQIYHDLGPFWGLPASVMRKEASAGEMTINIRNNNASAGSDWFWTQIWLNLTQTIEHLLPDMDLSLNAMDEPRINVPWEQVNKYMEVERASRKIPPASKVISEFQKLPSPNKVEPNVEIREKDWEEKCTFRMDFYVVGANNICRAVLGACCSRLSSRQSCT